MKTPKYRRKPNQGFSLIEILAVVTILALLIAILIPVTSKALASARINSALSEIRTLRTLVGDAASRMGGTLPLTEGIAAGVDDPALVTIDPTLTAKLPATNSLLTFTVLTTLDNVLMGLEPALMEANFKASLGQPFLRDSSVPPIQYKNGSYSAVPYPRNPNYMYNGSSFRQGGRVECAMVSRFFDVNSSSSRLANIQPNPGFDPTQLESTTNPRDIPAASGVNFTLDGVNYLPRGSRCALVIYETVPIAEAYEISRQLNAPGLLVSRTFSTASQTRGRVVYRGNPNSTTVYVYLAHF